MPDCAARHGKVGLGSWNPTILVDHTSKLWDQPISFGLTMAADGGRDMVVCDECTNYTVQRYMSESGFTDLRAFMRQMQVLDAELNRIGLQFERMNGCILEVKPSADPGIFKGYIFDPLDRVVREGAKLIR